MTKTYNTPKRTHIVKTRLDDEEHADFLRRLEIYDMNQSEFIREAISGATIKPTIVATLVSDDLLAAVTEQGLPIKQTKFETDKDKLREEIRMALSDAISFEDFAEKLLRRGITVKESRGRLSYLTPDRTKPITARKLGDDFDKAAVFAIFVRNAKRVRAKADPIHSATAMQKIINELDTVSRMVDVNAAKEKGKGYEHWAKKHNLKNASRAYLLYQEMGFDSPEALAAACDAAHEKLSDIRTEMKSVEVAIAEKKEQER